MSIILFFIILVVLILVHEFGHFIVAKKSGIRVDEFGIGFPPRLFGKTYGETKYTVNVLPFGGFVKIFGENPDEISIDGPDSARSFVNKPKWIQAAVLFAGVGFNVLLAWVLLSVGFMVGMPTLVSEEDFALVQDPRLAIIEVLSGSPAELAGLSSGDTVTSLSQGGVMLDNPIPTSVTAFIAEHGNEPITVLYTSSRTQETHTVIIEPTTGLISEEPERPAIGISMGIIGSVRHLPHIAIYEGGAMTVRLLSAVTVALAGFFTGILTFSADFSQIAGPVGIVGVVGDAAALGIIPLLIFTSVISLNLAVINLLPFPALDGGRLFFLLIETIKGSPIKPRIANLANTLGFALLILLMLFVTYHDIVKLF